MFKRTISNDALKVIKTLSYTEGEDSNNWSVVIVKWRNTELEKSMKSTHDTVLISGIIAFNRVGRLCCCRAKSLAQEVQLL